MKCSVVLALSNGRPSSSGEVGVRLRVSWCGLRTDVASGFVISPEKWDASRGCVKQGAKNSRRQSYGEINRALSVLSSTAVEILDRFEAENGRGPSVAEFRNMFADATGLAAKSRTGAAEGRGFFDVFDRFVRETGTANSWTEGTYKKLASVRRKLLAFDPCLPMAAFSKEHFAGWVEWMLTEARMANTTVAKNVAFLRWFLRWAAANGYYDGKAHEQYRPRCKSLRCKEVVYLEWDELTRFMTFDFGPSRPRLAVVRDVFCFCCFTGLRYSDVFKLRRSDLRLDASPPCMDVVTKKTNDRLRIELNRHALALLERYAGVELAGGKALPVISNQKMNDALHEAAQIAGLEAPVRVVSYRGSARFEGVRPKHEVLTSHAGRRTFVVNALRLGIPAPVIMEWTGHSDYEAMRPYIKIVDALKAESMAKFDALDG